MRTTRRAMLAGGAVGFGPLAGCIGGGFPAGIGGRNAPRGREGAGLGDGPPTADRDLPSTHDSSTLRDAAESPAVGPDGIPSIDKPQFRSADDPPPNLADDDPVFGLEIDGDARAYPQHILVWHEIVNDIVGDTPIAVTYCPLTGTAQGFLRGDVTFGVSGLLVNSNLVMFDRPTASWWPQVLARAIEGPYEGQYLEEVAVTWTTWGAWRSVHPSTRVLSEDTGAARNYGADPYGSYAPRSGYYANDSTLYPPLSVDDRFSLKDVVLGTRTSAGAGAVRKDALRNVGIIEGSLGDVPIVWVYDERLDTGYAYRNPAEKTVEIDGDKIVVDDGRHPPDELPLERLLTFDAMWLAWGGFYPDTEVHT